MDNVIDYLKKVFDEDNLKSEFALTNTHSISRFIEELESNKDDNNAYRLASCVAIDIKGENVSVDTYCRLINNIDWTGDRLITERFHDASKNISLFKTKLPDSTSKATNSQYVRVMTLLNYESRYIPKTKYSILKLNNDDDTPLEVMHINTDKPIPFTDMDKDKTMRGGKDCAWVLRQDQLNTVVNSDPKSKWADIFVDKAGFYIGNPIASKVKQYLYLEYPVDFTEEVYKPSAIHADWHGSAPYPYISAEKKDGWGYTFNMLSTSDHKDTFDERIHLPFHLYTSTADEKLYSIKAYGTSTIEKDHEHYPDYLIRARIEGIRRYEML